METGAVSKTVDPAATQAVDPAAYDFNLPAALWNEHPYGKRGDRRLMVLNRAQRSIRHTHLADLPEFLRGMPAYVNNSKARRGWLYVFDQAGNAYPIYLRVNTAHGWHAHLSAETPVPKSGEYGIRGGGRAYVRIVPNDIFPIDAFVMFSPPLSEQDLSFPGKPTWEVSGGG